MFSDTENFDQPLDRWNTSKVTNMEGVFWKAESFDQPLNKWDVSNVTNMKSMFCGATRFDQPLDKWNVSNVEDMYGIFEDSGLAGSRNYDNLFYGTNSEHWKIHRRGLR